MTKAQKYSVINDNIESVCKNGVTPPPVMVMGRATLMAEALETIKEAVRSNIS